MDTAKAREALETVLTMPTAHPAIRYFVKQALSYLQDTPCAPSLPNPQNAWPYNDVEVVARNALGHCGQATTTTITS